MSLSCRILRLAEQPIVPWKNGGGTTREVAVANHADRAGFRWRVSVAQVRSDGPFSLYPGVDRTLWLLRGAGMVLDDEGEERRLEQRLGRFEFAGERRISARLIDGPTEDLNVMVERATTVAFTELSVLPANASKQIRIDRDPARSNAEHLVLVLGGALRCRLDGESVALGTGDAVRWSDERGIDAHFTPTTQGTAILAAAFVPRDLR